MKKKLLALSIGAALTAATVPAMSAELKISGRAHVSVDHMNNGASGAAKQSGFDVSSNSSRVRISGKTQVAESLEAIMQIESGITIDDGSGSWASRDTFAGLKGDFGTVRLGMFDTPLKKVRSRTDMFGDRVGDARNITVGGFDNRFKNSVGYTSPNMSGLVFDLQYSANRDNKRIEKSGKATKEVELDKNREAISASVSYTMGGLTGILAHENISQGENTGFKNNDDKSATRLGLIYNVNKQVRVVGFYQNTDGFSTFAAGNVETKTGSRDIYGVGAYYKMGDYTLRGQYYMAEDLGSAKDTGANMVALGLDRSFGKDLTLYAVYANTSNDKKAEFSAVTGGHDSQVTTVNGKDVSAISLGLVYNF
jgi:predicted porin